VSASAKGGRILTPQEQQKLLDEIVKLRRRALKNVRQAERIIVTACVHLLKTACKK